MPGDVMHGAAQVPSGFRLILEPGRRRFGAAPNVNFLVMPAAVAGATILWFEHSGDVA